MVLRGEGDGLDAGRRIAPGAPFCCVEHAKVAERGFSGVRSNDQIKTRTQRFIACLRRRVCMQI